MNKAALIVVDVQNDFISGSMALCDCPAKQNGEEVVNCINSFSHLPEWDLVVYTQDWHPKDHISFVTNAHKFKEHQESKITAKHAETYDLVTFDIENSSRIQIMWPPHCIQDTWGAQLHSDLKLPENCRMVKKGSNTNIDSYSAFYDNDKIQETELRKLLEEYKITKTYVCGIATDICVNYTVRDSHELGFKTYLIHDACRGVNLNDINNCKSYFQSIGVQCIDSKQVEMELRLGK